MTPDDASTSSSSSSPGSSAPAKPSATPKKAAAAAAPSPSKTPAAETVEGATPATPAKPVKTEKAATVAKREAALRAKEEEGAEGPRAPKRATLEPEERRLLSLRRQIDRRRPLFVRTAAHRYARIGRWNSWRRPKGLQSKQRRHYGYRPVVVSIGFRSPSDIRGLTPTGFRPMRVTNLAQLEELEPKRHAAVIAHGVGVRKRLVLEEAARKKGVHVLNPILKEEVES